MTMRKSFEIGLYSLLGLSVLIVGTQAGEEKIAVKELPKAVLKAAKAKFPKAEIKGAAKEVEDGKTTYEVMLTLKGRSVDVAMKADGTILEIEKEISADDLPKAVKKAIAARYPKAKISKIETITKGEDGPVNYEVVLSTEVVLSDKGKFKEAAEEGEDEDKPAAKSGKDKKEKEDKDDDDDHDDKPKKKDEK
jgi:hypothetical protein